MKADYSFKVPFRDVDMHGHVHNSAYICYFEEAITEWIEASDLVANLDTSINDEQFFVKKIELIYHRSAKFNMNYSIDVNLAKLGNSSIQLHCQMFSEATDEAILISEECAVWVYVDAMGHPKSIGSPLREKLMALQTNDT